MMVEISCIAYLQQWVLNVLKWVILFYTFLRLLIPPSMFHGNQDKIFCHLAHLYTLPPTHYSSPQHLIPSTAFLLQPRQNISFFEEKMKTQVCVLCKTVFQHELNSHKTTNKVCDIYINTFKQPWFLITIYWYEILPKVFVYLYLIFNRINPLLHICNPPSNPHLSLIHLSLSLAIHHLHDKSPYKLKY